MQAVRSAQQSSSSLPGVAFSPCIPIRCEAGSALGRRGGLHEAGFVRLEIAFEGFDPNRMSLYRPLPKLPGHLVMDQALAEFHNLNVGVVGFPKLAFGQRLRGSAIIDFHVEKIQTAKAARLFIKNAAKRTEPHVHDR
jgi:hypothetical protein